MCKQSRRKLHTAEQHHFAEEEIKDMAEKILYEGL